MGFEQALPGLGEADISMYVTAPGETRCPSPMIRKKMG
jgi:hypothetical protein